MTKWLWLSISGFFPSQRSEKRAIYLSSRSSVPHQQGYTKPMPILSTAEVFGCRNAAGMWVGLILSLASSRPGCKKVSCLRWGLIWRHVWTASWTSVAHNYQHVISLQTSCGSLPQRLKCDICIPTSKKPLLGPVRYHDTRKKWKAECEAMCPYLSTLFTNKSASTVLNLQVITWNFYFFRRMRCRYFSWLLLNKICPRNSFHYNSSFHWKAQKSIWTKSSLYTFLSAMYMNECVRYFRRSKRRLVTPSICPGRLRQKFTERSFCEKNTVLSVQIAEDKESQADVPYPRHSVHFTNCNWPLQLSATIAAGREEKRDRQLFRSLTGACLDHQNPYRTPLVTWFRRCRPPTRLRARLWRSRKDIHR